jgi:predicted alpha/beta-hydrolase family hydrolase
MNTAAEALPVTVVVNETTRVSGLLEQPRHSNTCLVLAHGAGAGMQHPFMQSIATDLAQGGIATLRYQFPYMQRREKRPDPPQLCHATVRAAVSMAQELMPNAMLIAGGKSFGGRMTSQAQAQRPLERVRGLVFLGFPLHQPNKPSAERAMHLSRIKIPMLFIQGTRDTLAELDHLRPLIEALQEHARLKVIDGADHSFHVLKRSGRNDYEARAEMMKEIISWSAKLSSISPLG